MQLQTNIGTKTRIKVVSLSKEDSKEKARVFLSARLTIVRRSLGLLLGSHRDLAIVGESEALPELKSLTESSVDIVVIYYSELPTPNWLGLEEVKKISSAAKVIILFGHSPSPHLLHLLIRAGVHGFLNANCSEEVLYVAIRDAAAGKKYFTTEFLDLLAEAVVTHPKRQRKSSTSEFNGSPLSKREFFIICKIAEGYSSRQISEELEISPKTVDTHRSRAMIKLGLHSRSEVVEYALRSGWLTRTNG